MFNIDECENNGYFEAGSGAITRYAFSYLISDHGNIDEYRLYNQPFINFKNSKTDKLTIKTFDVNGETSPLNITSTHYLILEFEIDCGHKLSY